MVAAGYLGTLAYGAAQPPAPPANQPLAGWLVAHGLTDGLAGYWEANSTTLASGDRVLVSGVTRPPTASWCRTSGRPTTRATTPRCTTRTSWWPGARLRCAGCSSAALRTFGPPQRIYSYDGYTIMVWDTNLLGGWPGPGIVRDPGRH